MPAYRVPFFEELIKVGLQDEIKYEIYAGAPPRDADGRSDNVTAHPLFNYVSTRELKFLGRSILFHKIKPRWGQADLVISEQSIRNFVLYRWLFIDKPKRLALWGHGNTYTKKKTSLEIWLKSNLLNRCIWFFGYTEQSVKYVGGNGFPKGQTTIVRNSTDTQKIQRTMSEINIKEIDDFKSKFELHDGPIAIFIGALDPSKRLDFLLSSAIQIQTRLQDFQLLIFGSGPELKKTLTAIEDIPFIQYCGKANHMTLALISSIGSIIMMPGRVGLIAVDSFVLGLPIVTTKWDYHAPEVEYLIDGVNAHFSVNNLEIYSEDVVSIINDKKRLIELKRNCINSSKHFSIENMASNFHCGVKSALKIPENQARLKK